MEHLRQIAVTLDLGCDAVRPTVAALRGREALSEPFRYEIDFVADKVAVDTAPGSDAIALVRDGLGQERWITGVVASIHAGAGEESSTRRRFRIELVPLPWLVALRHGSRIFQDLSAPDVVRQVFKDAGIDAARFRWTLGKTYPRRDYIVQFDESEWDFVARLLEEEGIYYAFEHGPEGHVMVLADASDTATAVDPKSVVYQYEPALHGEAARAWDLHTEGRVAVARVALTDYDFERPDLDLTATAEATEAHPRECFEYPGRYADPAQGRRLARTRLEELRADRATLQVTTSALHLQTGRVFEVENHPSADGPCFATALELHVRVDREDEPSPLVDPGEAACLCTVTAIPKHQVFRPRRVTPRPRIRGLQTAVVTGPAGQEVYCDPHGRVKLQFPWDRRGRRDEKSSCWVRVAQAQTTGAMVVPRIGWEVLVQFLDGDPDRPVCLGRVFNPLFPPPFDLPEQKTVSALRSNTLPGGDGVNALVFDDTARAERLALDARRDARIEATRDARSTVDRAETWSVGRERTVSIGAHATVAVEGDQSLTVTAAHSVAVGSHRAVRVDGSASEEITGTLDLTVEGAAFLDVGGAEDIATTAGAEAGALVESATALAGSADAAALLGPIHAAVTRAAGLLGDAAALAGAGKTFLQAPARALQNAAGTVPAAGSAEAITLSAGSAAAVLAGALSPRAPGVNGSWSVTVAGDVSETLGALAVVNAARNVTVAVGGASTETAGAARIELVEGSRRETTLGSRTDTTGPLRVEAAEGIALEAGEDVRWKVSGKRTLRVGATHGLAAGAEGSLVAKALAVTGTGTVTLKCGKASVVLDASGVAITGDDVTIEGSDKLELDPAAIDAS